MTSPLDPADPTVQQQGRSRRNHVPEPASGVRGADMVDRMDPDHGTARGADGDTAAREQQRIDEGERRPGAGTESGDDLAQAGALGATDDPQGGSIQPNGAQP